ncbi:GtrA family protein [Methylocystis sp. MJC1]|jgi:putative flippase GtrA|uniref:GtrA family protein n=1 Tax=Methylocystis sp. MJC1 TaxID=2654282 RepID=UPI0019CFFA43|nr:GtrA family protein [Methylocystis sp. MJC1]MBU6528952.1 GtrA family protein [Methylocystis sp. MJC1]UZX11835.1 GtrA family protein [Methylocystis sp. MJC1]
MAKQHRHIGCAMTLRLAAERSARYTLIGAFCAAMHNVLLIGGDYLGLHYAQMNLASFSFVTPIGYLLHSAFTFQTPKSIRAFLRYASAIAAGVPLSIGIMAFLCDGLRLPVAIATPIATLVLFLWNYCLAHWAILGRFWRRETWSNLSR